MANSRSKLPDFSYDPLFAQPSFVEKSRDAKIYGDNTYFNMEIFIIRVLEIPKERLENLVGFEKTKFIIDFAVQTKEIQFTPLQNSYYKQKKAICDILLDDIIKMVCEHMDISPCPHDVNEMITEVNKILDRSSRSSRSMYDYLDITPIGFQLLDLKRRFSQLANSSIKTKGGRKTKRRSNTKSRRRNNKSKGRK